ncbi:MAG: nicotinamide-nucleotide amidohydrolase family protein [Proteobacteria bacterium]|nr:nicotinamide-nucleotide amidohydrolase family protein [Pseudomonadota bacterium]
MKAEVLTIGDELLRGEITDSNKSFLSQRLLTLDIETRFHVTCADDRADIAEVFRRAAARSEVVLVSGGLGPTRDDITIEVLAETFGRKLVLHEPSLEALRGFFARFGREMAAINEKQAWFPEGAEVLDNPIGTAPGTMLELQVAEGDAQRAAGERSSPGRDGVRKVLFFCMPGVPRELYKMMDEQVLPRIASRRRVTSWVRASLLRTFGIGESSLDEMLRDVALPEGVELGFRTQFPDNHVRHVARAASAAEADAKLARACEVLRERLGVLVYGEGEDTLELVTGRLLTEHRKTLAVAESCTGGMIGQLLTDAPGSSAFFKGGVVAYWNEAKAALLDVPEDVLAEHGAVSDPTARAMAEGARARFGTDLAVATTGIAGPTGGSANKPVGLIYVALASAEGSQVRELQLAFDRERNRRLTAQIAIDWVRRHLLGASLDLPRLGRVERKS